MVESLELIKDLLAVPVDATDGLAVAVDTAALANGDDELLEALNLEPAAANGFPPAGCEPKIPGLASLAFPPTD